MELDLFQAHPDGDDFTASLTAEVIVEQGFGGRTRWLEVKGCDKNSMSQRGGMVSTQIVSVFVLYRFTILTLDHCSLTPSPYYYFHVVAAANSCPTLTAPFDLQLDGVKNWKMPELCPDV